MATHSSILIENPMERGAWQTTVQGVAKNGTQLSKAEHAHTHVIVFLGREDPFNLSSRACKTVVLLVLVVKIVK